MSLSGAALIADPSGALYWPEHGLLVVADLHLEKGSSYAARGQLLPPYDTAATLSRLARRLPLLRSHAPPAVLCRASLAPLSPLLACRRGSAPPVAHRPWRAG